jgi:lipid-A-disaccharide synthase
MTCILMTAGESSGEIHGADLVHEFKKQHPQVEFFGIGGSHMEQEGVRLLYSSQELAVVGLVEVLRHLPRIKQIFNGLIKEIERKKPSAAVLIDSPDFNLRLAKKINKMSIPILYYISPTVWIWRKGRLKSIKKTVHRMMLIFPFEEDIYRQNKIPAVYVGHPLTQKISITLSRDEFLQKYGLDPEKKHICVLPGSRRSEIRFHLPILIKAMAKISCRQSVHFFIILSENMDSQLLFRQMPLRPSHVTFIKKDRYTAMAHSDLAISACGTANLELALLETPFLAFYRLSPLTYHIGLPFLKLRSYSIVNILAGKKVVTELIQRRFTAKNVTSEAEKLLTSQEIRNQMIAEFKRVKDLLGDKKASFHAAKELNVLLETAKRKAQNKKEQELNNTNSIRSKS